MWAEIAALKISNCLSMAGDQHQLPKKREKTKNLFEGYLQYTLPGASTNSSFRLITDNGCFNGVQLHR